MSRSTTIIPYIEPALRAFGCWRVQETLLADLEQGTLRKKAGAARACYWAWSPCDEDLWVRRDLLLLKTCVEIEGLDVRRSIIFSLSLKPSDYSEV